MSHSATSSTASTLTLHENDLFQGALLDMMNPKRGNTTEDLFRSARATLRLLTPNTAKDILYLKVKGHAIDLRKLLEMMLQYARICGGTRYVACAILAAEKLADHSQPHALVARMTELAQDWVFFLLWPIKKAYRSPTAPLSGVSTPTIEMSESAEVNTPPIVPDSLRDQVLMRDGYKCVVTGRMDENRLRLNLVGRENYKYTGLQLAHILRRAVFVDTPTSKYVLPATVDMIKHFARLPDAVVNDIGDRIDTSENTFMLDRNWHGGFDNFLWCLLPVNMNLDRPERFQGGDEIEFTDYEYRVHWFEPLNTYDGAPAGPIRLTNHADPRIQARIPLPNPRFIAFHAAISHVLNMSGAGEVIDRIIDDFSEPRVPSGPKARELAVEDDLPLRLSILSVADGNRQLRPTGVAF